MPRRGGAPLAVVRVVPAWVWLAGLVVLSTLFRFALARRTVAPWIMVDEIIYSELAKSFADTGSFSIREEPVGLAYGFVYPLLLSPAYALYEAVPDVYGAIKLINALVMSLTAVPAYLLARRVLSQPLSLLAAVLSVALPGMLYTATVMTENAFYPLFVSAALALVLVLERPTLVRVVGLLAVSGLAFFTRVQAVVLLPAMLTAPLLLVWLDRRGRGGLRPYRWLYGLVAAGAGLLLAFQLARGRSPGEALGAYRAAGDLDYDVGDVLGSLVLHLAELDLALGVVPFAALIVLVATARRVDEQLRVFLAAALALGAWTILQVATFASALEPFRVEERNMFYVAPLFLIALLAWIERGLPRPRAWTLAAAGVAAALPAFLPYPSLIGTAAVSDTFALLPWWTVHLWGVALHRIWLLVLIAACAVAALYIVVPRRFALVLPAVVLAYFAVSIQPVESRIREASIGALFQATTRPQRDWVDRSTGPGAEVAVIWSNRVDVVDRLFVNVTEFFNRSVGRVYHLAGPTPGSLPETAVTLDRRTGRLLQPSGSSVTADYVLTDETVPLGGRLHDRDERKGVTLHSLRAAATYGGAVTLRREVTGVYDDGWSGPEVTYRSFACVPGRLRIALESDPKLFRRPQTVVARVGGRVVSRRTVHPDRRTSLNVPLVPNDHRCTVRFSVSPTAVPAEIQGGDDTRRLGMHFRDFTEIWAR